MCKQYPSFNVNLFDIGRLSKVIVIKPLCLRGDVLVVTEAAQS